MDNNKYYTLIKWINVENFRPTQTTSFISKIRKNLVDHVFFSRDNHNGDVLINLAEGEAISARQ